MPVMPERVRDALSRVTDQGSFIQELLVDALEWDVPSKAESIEELGYEWYLDEDFDFSEDDRRNLAGAEIVQVPISRDTDLFGDVAPGKWGVFIIPFRGAAYLEKGRGLTSPLRKMLRTLMRQKADLPSFACENILFICADQKFENVTFARFKRLKGKGVPPLATFGWNTNDKSAIRTLCEHNLPNLHWNEDWAKAFEIERVTKAFYQEIFEWFETARPLIKLPLKDAVRVLERSEDDLKSEAVIRLVIRMIFIWFMKEKRGLVPEALFDRTAIQDYLHLPIDDENHTYYSAVLQNLFFATLNCPQDSRRFRRDHEINDTQRAENDRGISILYRFKDDMSDPEGMAKLLSTVPFLNGGLFTCHDNIQKFVFGEKRESYHLDGFSENLADRAIVPDRLFFSEDQRSGLIDILKRYHFTIEEHTPLEQEVALDPELLGHVFENLLAAYNPETKETARKKTGSYYTPRNIVDYMVGESLYHYLLGKMNWHEDQEKQAALRSLLDYEYEGNPFNHDDCGNLRAALYTVRIFDPACGSGAFPMGALQRLNHVLERLNEEKTSYQRKLELISRNIYGADIQPIATEITTQRFFISLLIDQEVEADKPNCGVEPLPNLEVKFMTANTLQSLHWQDDRDTGHQHDMFYDAVNEQVAAIKAVFIDFLEATTAKRKDELRAHFENYKTQLLDEFAKVGIRHHDRELFQAWEPFGFSRSAGFFDAQLMFGQARFDIVIGNPPYVRQEAIKDIKPALKEEFGPFFKGTADLYTYFYKRGIELLKPGGVLAYITPNKFMSTAYGDKTRQLLSEEAFPLVLIDFNEFPVFEATTYPLIAIIKRAEVSEGAVFSSLPEKELAKGKWTDPDTAIRDHGFEQPIASLKTDKWLLEKPEILSLLDKFDRAATPLGKYVNDAFYRGVLTGLNEAFVINADVKRQLLEEDQNSASIIKPWLKGRDVNKWTTQIPDDFVIFTRRGTDISQYRAVEEYLSQYREDLEPKMKAGQKKGRKPGSYQWYEIQDNVAYHAEFSRPRIVYPNIANKPQFCWEEREVFNNDKAFIIPTDDKFLLAVLNSKVSAFWCWNSLPKLMGGTMEFRKVFMQNLPIPNASAEQKAQLAKLADQILDLKEVLPDADVRKLEKDIDQRVYSLFALTPEEISLVERGQS